MIYVFLYFIIIMLLFFFCFFEQLTVGLVHPKFKILSSFIVMLNIKEDILKNAGNQRVYGPN